MSIDPPFELSHLSHSSVNMLLECPRKFALRKIHHAPETPGWANVGGTSFHTATEIIDRAAHDFDQNLETFYGIPLSDVRLRTGQADGDAPGGADAGEEPFRWETDMDLPCLPGQTPQSLWDEAFSDEIDKVFTRTTRPDEDGNPTEPGIPIEEWRASGRASKDWPNKQDQEWWMTNGPIMVADYVTWRLQTQWPIAVTPDGTLAIELEVNVAYGPGTKGYIDRLFWLPDGTMVVVDLKSGARMSPEDQLGDYAAKVEAVFGRRPEWGSFYKAREGKHTGPTPLGQYTQEYMEYRYSAAQHIIQLGEFPPRVSDACGWCSQANNCAIKGGSRAKEFDPLYELLHKEKEC